MSSTRPRRLKFVDTRRLVDGDMGDSLHLPFVLGVAVVSCLTCGRAAWAEVLTENQWDLRVAAGYAYVSGERERPDGRDDGVGAAVDLAWRWTRAWRLGVTYEFEVYRWSAYGEREDDGTSPNFSGEWLLDQRLMGVVRFEPLASSIVSPFAALGLGAGKAISSLHSLQCEPKDPFGPVGEVLAGIDVGLGSDLRIGLEWRAATPPLTGRGCTLLFIPGEPPDPPYDIRQRLMLGATFEKVF